MTTVILLIGLPASGKSSLSRALCASRTSSVHIEYDDVAAHFGDDDELERWRKSRVAALDSFKSHFARDAPPALIVMDDNFHLRSMRKTIYRLCQEQVELGQKVFFGEVLVETPREVCLERNSHRNDGARVPDHVIEKMSSTLEPPDPDQSSWESNYLVVQGSDVSSAAIMKEWLLTLQEYPVQLPPPEIDPHELEEERQKTRESRLHNFDKRLRQWVGQVARCDKTSTAVANSTRKELLARLRTEDLSEDTVVDQFCKKVCSGWSNEKVQQLRQTLAASLS